MKKFDAHGGARRLVRGARSGELVPSTVRGGRAFTLIELLIVIAIIALLISLILPSMSGAKRTAWKVICQSNLKQIGMATRMYLDEQKDPQYFNLRNVQGAQGLLYQVGIVDILNPYLSNQGSKAFDCPAAKGLSSVRDPVNIVYLARATRVYTLPLPPFALTQPVTQYTEYWFNDSEVRTDPGYPFRQPVGVAGQKERLIKWPQYMVLSTDALDEFPRHLGAKANARKANDNPNDRTGNVGQNNILFADLAVKAKEYVEYQEFPDPAGAPGPFFNWGHAYPR